MCSVFKCIFACLLPPLAVLLDKGCNCDFCLNLFLTLLGYFPGCIHAYCVICRDDPHPVYIQGMPQQTIVNVVNSPQPQPIYTQPQLAMQQPMQQPFHYPPSQPYSPDMAGHAAYPMPSHHQMSAPPAYDNPSAPAGNEYNFKQKFDE